jgi:Rad3-related DNA helicase
MDRGLILDLALKLFPYAEVYPQQKDFMKRMIDTIADGKVGIFESPTGTVYYVDVTTI